MKRFVWLCLFRFSQLLSSGNTVVALAPPLGAVASLRAFLHLEGLEAS